MTPVVVTVAITGSVPRKKDNPAVPITPTEQIESTREAFEAGATLAHIHVRNDDETPSSDPERFAAMKDQGGNGVAGGESRDLTKRTHGQANFPQQAVWGWRQLPVPVIAAIQGVAFGGGFQLALGADMRFLTPDARMSIMEIKWGLVPDMAGTPILATLVRDDILRELTYTGRIFSAQEAMSYGLATRICDDPRAAALELAREIAGKSPDAIRAAKRMLNNLSVDPGPALLAESVEQQKLLGSPNQTEAVRANMEKRAPRFAEA